MNLDEFIRCLHVQTDRARPPGWETDWADAPLPYKLYRNRPVFPFASEVPLKLGEKEAPAKPDTAAIGHLLWYSYGLARVSQSVAAAEELRQGIVPAHLFRRFAASGGGLYPNELYIYLRSGEWPRGVYHYDAAHHRLAMLREGDFDEYAARALGGRGDLSGCFGVVFVSVMFRKNFYKYHNFSYRLQGMDTGLLLGQLLEAARRLGFSAKVCYQFLDRAVNHLIGLSEDEESVYAVIPLSATPLPSWPGGRGGDGGGTTAGELCRELPAVRHEQYVRSRRTSEYPMLLRMNEACMQESARDFRELGGAPRVSAADGKKSVVPLPHAGERAFDFASVCRSRYSPEHEFVLGEVSRPKLAALLQAMAAASAYDNDLASPLPPHHSAKPEPREPRISVYGCFYNVEGLPDGAYRYEPGAHGLRPVHAGDLRRRLQRAMTLDNVNLSQVPLCFHLAGDADHLNGELGYRGYRIQQMEAGMLVQRLLLAAAAAGFGGRPLFGYDARMCDELYSLPAAGETSLIQIPVGPYRPRARQEAGLHR